MRAGQLHRLAQRQQRRGTRLQSVATAIGTPWAELPGWKARLAQHVERPGQQHRYRAGTRHGGHAQDEVY